MSDADLIRAVDDLEARAAGYVTLADVEHAAGHPVHEAIASGLLLIDDRERIDPATGTRSPLTLCRLNRHHPLVRHLTAW